MLNTITTLAAAIAAHTILMIAITALWAVAVITLMGKRWG